jgi:hypothetical protein
MTTTWRRSSVIWLGLAVVVLAVGLVRIVAIVLQPTPHGAEQTTEQRGRGLVGHEELIETWADHLHTGDYRQLRDLTVQGQGWTFDLLQEHAERERGKGRMQSYRVTRLEPAGTFAKATLHFVGDGKRDICLPVQSDGRKVNVLADFRWCRDGE